MYQTDEKWHGRLSLQETGLTSAAPNVEGVRPLKELVQCRTEFGYGETSNNDDE